MQTKEFAFNPALWDAYLRSQNIAESGKSVV